VKILIIEDDQRYIKDIAFCMAVPYSGAIIMSASSGLKGIEMVETEMPDLVMVASSLPDMNALDVISGIRQFSDIPLLILTEEENDIDRAMALEAGADDYIIKPFSPIELIARVKALLRRIYRVSFKRENTISVGTLTINFGTRQVSLSGRQVKLTPHEYNLLVELVRNEGRVLPHSVLLEKVWGLGYVTDYTFIKKYIYRLRCKLELDPDNPQMFLSERGVGYRLVRPVE
jgi:two-component system, OmpR family, KDP operon response regulator KdpE